MKKKEFLTAVIVICVFGMTLTSQVRRFVSGNAEITHISDERKTEVAANKIPFGGESDRKTRQNEAEGRLQDEKIQDRNFQNRSLEDSQKQSSTADQIPIEEERKQESLTTEAEETTLVPEKEGTPLPKEETVDDSDKSDKTLHSAKAGNESQGEFAGKTVNGLRTLVESLALSSITQAESSKTADLSQEEKQPEPSELSESPALAAEVEKDSSMTAVIPPISILGEGAETVSEEMTEQDYRHELDETAAQIEKLKNSETSTTAWSYLNMADYELKLWDEQLNEIYEDIVNRLEPEAAEALRQEERKWISEKDAAAKRAASRCRGGALEGLEHTASLAASTKERAYYLLDTYGSSLPQEEK